MIIIKIKKTGIENAENYDQRKQKAHLMVDNALFIDKNKIFSSHFFSPFALTDYIYVCVCVCVCVCV